MLKAAAPSRVNKRPLQDSDACNREPPQKKPADSGDVRNAHLQLTSQDNNGGAQIGSQNVIRKADTKVQSIELTNFMCHSSLKLEFDTAKHNCFYIVGANGSGKSAIFAALNIGLGGKGRANDRGSSLQAYIKEGQDSARIRIVLDNCGAPYPNFGDQIIVERSITRTASTFVLKTRNTPGDSEKVISRKKSDLDAILRHFNIELENPLSWLSQDRARQFLQQMKPEKLYEIYYKSTELHSTENIHREVKANVTETKGLLDQNNEKRIRKQAEYEDLLKRYQAGQKIEETKIYLCQLMWKALWSKVKDVDQEIASEDRNIAKIAEAKCRIQKNITNNEEKIKAAESEKTAVSSRVEELQKEFHTRKAEHRDKGVELSARDRTVRDTKDEMGKIVANMKLVEKELKLAEIQLRKVQGNANRDLNVEKEQLQSEKIAAQQKLNKLKEQKEQLMQTLKECDEEFSNKARSYDMVQGEVRKIGGDIERAKRDLQTFNASRRNRLALLGPHVMEVMKLIRDNKRLFKTEPIGPIGGHVKLRDEKWATSVEFCLKGMLNKFICDSMEDRRVLDELCRKRKIRADVITYKCSRPKIDTSSGQPPQKFLTIERAIDISVDVVHNVLVDHLAIEGILLIESDDEARNLMRTNPPPNVHMTQTLSCSVVYPRRSTRSNYRYYANPKFVSRFFDKDTEFSKRDFKAESATLQNLMEQKKRRETELSREKSDAENSLRHIRGKLDAICHEIHATTLDLKAIDERENELLKIMSSSDLIETFKETIAELENRRQEIVDQLEEAKRTLAVKESEKDETKQAVDEITGQLTQTTVALKNANERLRSLGDQEEKCIASIDNERIRLEKCDHLTKKHTEDKKVLSQRRETLEQECYEKVNEDKISYQQPPGMCIPPDYNDIPPTKELDAEIAATERQIRLANESLDCARLITTEQLIHFRETNKTFCKRFERYMNIYERVKKLLSNRRIRLNALKWSMPLLLEKAFVENMSHRNFRGTLMVDNAARRIEIKVETHKTATQSQSRSSSQARFSQAPESIDNQVQSDDDDDDRTQGKANKKKALQDLKGLSGGERSYTTSCFVMALWNCVDSPFCCLDEFDVFMDMINRRFVMEMLVEYAESNKWSQFFFFTPQDISELGRDQDHVQIFNMPKVRET